LNLKEIFVQPVGRSEEQRYQDLMHEHHYLGRLPKISETLWYIAFWRDQWAALLRFLHVDSESPSLTLLSG
jgi:hypothetical protein